MKDPDGVYDSVSEAAKKSVEDVAGLSKSEREGLVETRRDGIFASIKKWFQYREYLTVEVDTDAGTCTVVKEGA